MVKALWLVLFVMLQGCSAFIVDEPDMVTPHGVSFFFQDGAELPLEVASAQEEYLLENIERAGYTQEAVLEEMSHTTVDLVPEPFECQGGLCAGMTEVDGSNHVTLAVLPCIWRVAYIHELAHIVQNAHGFYDYEHEEETIWEIADGHPFRCE